MKFARRFQKFMYGRYGPDDLYKFLFKVYLILFFINIFLNSIIITYIELFIIVWMFYRFFSKKIYKRSGENVAFLKAKKRFFKPFNNIKRKIKDKDHIYKKCHKCNTILKLSVPFKRGIKTAKCPHCNNRIKVLVLRKQKVEIIRD